MTVQNTVLAQILRRRCQVRGQVKAAVTPLPHGNPLQSKHLESRNAGRQTNRVSRRKEPSHARAHPTRPGPASLEKRGSNNVKRRGGGVRLRDQMLASAMASGESGPAPGTKAGTFLQVEDLPTPRSSNVLKRSHIQCSVRPVSSSDVKQSQRIPA